MIYLLHPTIRPEMFKETISKWLDNADDTTDIEIKVCVNTQEQCDVLNGFDVVISESEHIGVCYSAYKLSSVLQANNDDIVILTSDDFIPPKSWDTYVKNKLNGFDGALLVNDGFQPSDINKHPGKLAALTIPIMTFSCLRKLNGAIYHPSFRHMFSDVDVFITLRDLNMIKDDRIADSDIVFMHNHYANGKRAADENDREYNNNWKSDEDNYNKRLEMSTVKRLEI